MGEADLQPLVTRCPDCATQFRVSEAQLQVAKGKVRCGSCLTVFEGVDNLVWDAEPAPEGSADETLDDLLDQLTGDPEPAEPTTEPGEDTPADLEVLAVEDSVDESVLETVEEAAAETLDEITTDLPSAWPQAEEESPAPEPQQTSEVADTPADAASTTEADPREQLVAQLIAAAETQPEPTPLAEELIEVPAEEDLIDLGSIYVGPDYASLQRTDEERAEEHRRSRNRREAMAEIRALEAEEAAAQAKAQQAREAERAAAAQQAIDENNIADTPVASPAVALGTSQSASTGAAYPGESELEQVWERKPDQPAAASYEYDEAAGGESDARRRNWRIPAIAAATVLLIAQIMYLQFAEWSVNPMLRPVYAAACGVLRCELPFRRDMAKLKSRNLKVRSHPEIAGKLLADALIVNEAEFDQPFPVLRLGFSDASGNAMDSQRFEPTDYLAGDMAGATLMPARTPVHISVVAEDPGPQALGYTLKLE